jgi:hypothetical protein
MGSKADDRCVIADCPAFAKFWQISLGRALVSAAADLPPESTVARKFTSGGYRDGVIERRPRGAAEESLAD